MANDEEIATERAAALDRILTDPADRKLIVAGAGTGKTFTFSQVVDATEGRCLILTFLNMLVADIAQSMGDRADVYSFHGFARSLLHKLDVPGITKSVAYYPAIPEIYERDLEIVGQPAEVREIERALMNLIEDDGIIDGVVRSGDYYNVVGHTDSVYRIYRLLSADPAAVPTYAKVLVDEYQDFSRLEVELIDSLAANPIIVVGDDDQALYRFRHATAQFIRELVVDDRYANFELAFCSRCTQVIVAATHTVVTKAQQAGLLQDRIDKRYDCYVPDKRDESDRYPKITHVSCTVDKNNAPYMARYIERFIDGLDPDEVAESHAKGYPTLLIIGPRQFTSRIHDYLQERGYPNISRKESTKLEVHPLDGYRRLMKDEHSRLGWRILLHCHLPRGYERWIRQALFDGNELAELIHEDYREAQLDIVQALKRLVDGTADAQDEESIAKATGSSIDQVKTQLRVAEEDADAPEVTTDTEIDPDAPTILFTSLMGSKGLQAGHVFVVGLNDGHFPRDNEAPTEDEVCQLIVALTRTRKSCTLLSCRRFGPDWVSQSIFVQWLRDHLNELTVNKTYLDG